MRFGMSDQSAPARRLRFMDTRNLAALLLATSAMTVIVFPAQAQQTSAPAAAAPATEEAADEKVTVTAQKRRQELAKVPASVSVLKGSELEKLNVTSMSDWSGYVPGLTVQSQGAAGSQIVTLEGIAPIGAASLVRVYVGDTPIGSSGSYSNAAGYTPDLIPYDIERIEVLRGPQGTLYGASSMGGVIKYVMKSPDLNDFSARLGGDVFSIDGSSGTGGGVRGAVNIPIVEGELGLTASGYNTYSPGYMKNLTTNQDDNNSFSLAGGRVALLWNASDNFTVEASALNHVSIQRNSNRVTYDPVTRKPFPGGDEYSNRVTRQERLRQDLSVYDLTANLDLGFANLTSVSSYQEFTTKRVFDSTPFYGIYASFFGFGVQADITATPEVKKFTQEVRLSSPTNDNFEWIAGLYYTNEDSFQDQLIRSYSATGVLTPGVNPIAFAILDASYEEIAGFADVTYHVTPEWNIGGGLRYSQNDQTYQQPLGGPIFGSPVGVPLPPTRSGTSSESVTTWNINTSYEIDTDTFLYARVGTGFQPGGPNAQLPGVVTLLTFDSSTLTNYEAGFRTRFWEGKGALDLHAFYIDWKDIQVSTFDPGCGCGGLANGPSARSQGADLTVSVAPVKGLRFSGNLAYTDATATAAIAALNTVSGARLPGIPKWAGSLKADYTTAIDEQWDFVAGLGYRYKGESWSGVQGATSGGLQASFLDPSYNLFDAQIGVQDDSWKVALYVKNLTNESYLSGQSLSADLFGAPVGFNGNINQPRTVGLSVDKAF